MGTANACDRGRESLTRRAWGKAYAQLSAADLEAPLEPEDLDRLATVAHLLGHDTFEEELLEAVRRRSPGESVVAAFGRFVLAPRGALASHDPAAVERLAAMTPVITGSPALLAREREIFERFAASLAGLIAEEAGMKSHAVEPEVAANALLGVHRAMLVYVRRRALTWVPPKRIAREARARGELALGLLERGLSQIDLGPEPPANGQVDRAEAGSATPGTSGVAGLPGRSSAESSTNVSAVRLR